MANGEYWQKLAIEYIQEQHEKLNQRISNGVSIILKQFRQKITS